MLVAMDKIYRRNTQRTGTPKKKKNEKNRVRNTIVNFRVSPKEKELIEARISLLGMPKAEFFIESCLYQAVLVKGNIRSFTELKNKVSELYELLEKNPDLRELDEVKATELRTILEILENVFGKEK